MITKNKDPKLANLLLLLNTTNLIFSLGVKLLALLPNIAAPLSRQTDLTALPLSPVEQQKLRHPDWSLIAKDLAWAAQEHQHIISIYDPDYPPLLKEIPNPPLILFVMGDLTLLQSCQLAMVGSRNPTPSGTETAYTFAQTLVKLGITITSGGALGIDAASHKGAVDANGRTIAVMGTGLNHIYPACHAALAQKILAAQGVLVSEFPLDAQAKRWHFPLRNRIISGLSIGALVVEATIRSGSLVTAKCAGEQGREVFAVPGSIYNPAARGCHYLIRQGAKLVEQPQDIVEEFPQLKLPLQAARGESDNATQKNKLDCEYKKLLDCIGFEVTPIDLLAGRMKLPVALVNTMLVELELQGWIKMVMGGYIKVVSKNLI